MTKQEYWDLTPAETKAKYYGYRFNRDIATANFRELFTLQHNQWVKEKDRKKSNELWPLEYIDGEDRKPKNTDDLYERNKKIIEQMTKGAN